MMDPTGTQTLAELLFHAEQFCLRVDKARDDRALSSADGEELRLKIGQARNIIAVLQQAFDDDELFVDHAPVRANFRHLIMSLLWVSFYGRDLLDFRTYRMLVMIESSYTLLLNSRG